MRVSPFQCLSSYFRGFCGGDHYYSSDQGEGTTVGRSPTGSPAKHLAKNRPGQPGPKKSITNSKSL